MKLLNSDGLSYFWLKIKILLSGKADQNHTHTDLEARISNIENALKSGSIKTWGDLVNHADKWEDLL